MKNNETKWVPVQYIFEDGHIELFPGYEVSDKGEIRSLNYKRTGEVRVMKQGTAVASGGSMWYQVALRKNSKTYRLPTHRVVLSSFRWPEYFPNADVDHVVPRDENSCCNLLSNLRWITRQQNTSTGHRKALMSKVLTNRPDKSKRVKVIFSDSTYRVFPSTQEAERSLDLPHNTISIYIRERNGYYKKRQLHFEYVK